MDWYIGSKAPVETMLAPMMPMRRMVMIEPA
jgi:hypothetical protein